jgi:hypothetical protein
VGEQYNCHGRRLLLQVDELTVSSVLPQWTDAIPPDAQVVMGEGRAHFRVSDLVELARLAERLRGAI